MKKNIEIIKSIGTQEIILLAINKFEPIIKKYSRLLKYDGAETDLVIALIKLLDKLPDGKNEKVITSYIAKSIKNEYIKLSKKNGLIAQKEVPLKMEYIGKECFDIETIIDVKDALKTLTANQRKIVKLIMHHDYSDTELAKKLNITRQAINKTKKAAFKKIKAYIE